MNWLNKLERKFGRWAVPNFMLTVVIGMAIVYVLNMFFPAYNITNFLALIPAQIARGQVWRLITFIFIPPSASPVFVVFALYFYYSIGTALENSWGSFKFNIFYLLGVIGAIVASLLTGYATNTYLNLSLFFAFAILYPDTQFLLFFVIPVKAKYLAVVDAVLYVVTFISSNSWSTRAAIIAALVNIAIFFGGDVIRYMKRQNAYRATRRNFKQQMRETDWRNR